jgi:choline kinase
MKLFILAAGVGSRLYPLTKNTPKSLLDLGDGTTLLERQIENAIHSKYIDEVIIITGYKTEQIEAKVKDLEKKIKITIVYNPFYDVSNNLISLWCAHHLMNDDFIITNGDNIYKDTVYDKIIQAASEKKDTIQITLDYKDHYDDDDMKITFDGNGHISRIHKDIPTENAKAESVGLVVVKGSKSKKIFVDQLLSLVKNKEYINKFWLEIFNVLIQNYIIIDYIEIDKDDWREMDFHPDIEIIKQEMLKNLI